MHCTPISPTLLCFESSLTREQVQAVKRLFCMTGKNVFVIAGGEEPKVFQLGSEKPVEFPEQRMFLVGEED
jgi:hypothetical protein